MFSVTFKGAVLKICKGLILSEVFACLLVIATEVNVGTYDRSIFQAQIKNMLFHCAFNRRLYIRSVCYYLEA